MASAVYLGLGAASSCLEITLQTQLLQTLLCDLIRTLLVELSASKHTCPSIHSQSPDSMHIPERICLVAQLRQLLTIIPSLAALSQLPLAALVDSGVADVEDDRRDYPQGHKAQLQPVPEDVAGGVRLAVEVRGHGSAEVAHPDLDRHPRAALVAAGEVVGQPCDVAWEAWVDGAHDYEDAAVDHAGVFGWVC